VTAALVAIGLLICSATEVTSRATLVPSTWFLWAGLSLIVAPVVYRLCAAEASVGERIALVSLLGLSLYAVKVMRDPYGYTMADEFLHAYNAQQITAHHHLFSRNPILPASARYPGLEGATSALMTLTGMSSFGAGLIVVAAARVTVMLGLFMLFLVVSRSPRVAGLAAAIYTANGNFLLWASQYSYESLALPVLVVVLALVARRAAVSEREKREWSVPIVIGIAAVVITHHITSYLLAAVLILLVLAPRMTRGRAPDLRLGRFAALSVGLTLAWLFVVASQTVGYVSPLINDAFSQAIKTITGESPPRGPFTGGGSANTTPVTPVPERVIAYLALLILLIALPFGLRAVWRRYRWNPFACLFCLGALGFFGALGLRFAPSAWEIGNRMAEFFFIGLAFVVAHAILTRLLSRRRAWMPALVGLLVAVVAVGDWITGWPVDNVLPSPVRAEFSGHAVPSETFALGQWVRRDLKNAGIGALEGDARSVLLLGENGHVISGETDNINRVLTKWSVTKNQLYLLKAKKVRYVVIDARLRAGDVTRAYAFSVHPPGGPTDAYISNNVAAKFDRLPVARIYDSGSIYIYDLNGAV
jgi:hypothetical protein